MTDLFYEEELAWHKATVKALGEQQMPAYKVKDGREPSVVYQTIGGWTYRVLDLYDMSRFGGLYQSPQEAKHEAEANGYYVVGGRWIEK